MIILIVNFVAYRVCVFNLSGCAVSSDFEEVVLAGSQCCWQGDRGSPVFQFDFSYSIQYVILFQPKPSFAHLGYPYANTEPVEQVHAKVKIKDFFITGTAGFSTKLTNTKN